MPSIGATSVTVAVVAPAVPLKVTSPVAKPVTGSLKTTVKLIGLLPVGSTWPLAWLMVTVGAVVSGGGVRSRPMMTGSWSEERYGLSSVSYTHLVVNGVNLADEDIVRYDASTCAVTTVFDGTAAGLPASANLDAIAVKDGVTYFSLLAPATVPGIAGKVDDSDVVAYDGSDFTLFIDGSANGLTTNAEDVDAIAFDETGKLLLSTLGGSALAAGLKGSDEDLLRFDAGVWTLRFDGSHSAGLANEDIVGAAVADNGDIYLSLLDGFNVGGISGNAADVFICTPVSLGALNTTCAYSLFWNATSYGLPAFDAIEME